MALRRNRRVGFIVFIMIAGLIILFFVLLRDLDVRPGSGIGGYIKAISEKIAGSLSRGIGR